MELWLDAFHHNSIGLKIRIFFLYFIIPDKGHELTAECWSGLVTFYDL